MSSTFGHAMGRSVSALAVATLFSGAALADPIPPSGQGDLVGGGRGRHTRQYPSQRR